MIHTSQQARKLFLSLVCIQLLLVVIYGTDAWVHGPAERLDDVIDLDAEGNLPTWFSSFQLALIAISFWALASRVRETGRPSRRFLKTCGGFFLLLSIDETAMFHERITASVGSRYVDWLPAYLTAHIGSAIVCAFVVAACVAGAYPHLRGLWILSRRAMLIGLAGGVVYLTGGALLETIGYKMLSAGVSLSLYRVEVAFEEFFEMLGASLILYAVLLFCCLVAEKQRSRRLPSQSAESCARAMTTAIWVDANIQKRASLPVSLSVIQKLTPSLHAPCGIVPLPAVPVP